MGKNRQTPTIKRLLCVLLSGLVVLSPFDVRASTWSPTVLVNTESFQIMDDGDSSTDIELRFGGILNEILEFDRTNSRFHFTDDLLVDGDLSSSGTLSVETLIKTDGNISMNLDQSAADTILTFGSDTTNETLTFENTNDQFAFTDDLEVRGNLSGAWIHSEGSLSASGNLFLNGGTFTGATVFHGPFTADCDDATNSKLLWDSATGKFSCGTDQTGGSATWTDGGDFLYPTNGEDVVVGGSTEAAYEVKINTGSRISATFSGGLVVNEAGNDNDTRMEGDTDTNLLFLDASTDRVGIRSATPGARLHVGDGTSLSRDAFLLDSDAPRMYFQTNDTKTNWKVSAQDSTSNAFEISIGGTDATATDDTYQQAIVVTSATRVGIDTTTPAATLSVSGSMIVNDAGGDNDVRMEGDTDANLLFLDASTDRIGIGTATPETKFDVSGSISGSALRVSGNATVHGTLTASGTVRFDDNFTINDDQTAADSVFTFGSDGTNETLAWENTADQFAFTDDLEVRGNLSGAWIHSEGSLSASGTLFLNGGTFTGATVFHGPFTSDCDDATNSKLLWDSSTGRFSCGTDQTGGSSGITQAQGDARFVNVHGDTMTGSLQIRSGSGVKAVGLEVTGTMSGRALVIQGTASGSIPLLTATGTTNRVGILTGRTNPPETALDVVGTISGTMLRVSSGASIHGALTASGTVRFDGDILRINDDQTADTNAVLTFGSDDTNETLSFADIGDRFEFSDDVATTGSLNASGAILTEGNLTINDDADSNNAVLTFGSDTTNETLTWNNISDMFQFSDDVNVTGALSASGAVSFESFLDVSSTISGAALTTEGTLSASGKVFFQNTLTGALAFFGPFTSDCDDATNSKLLWDSATGKFSCGTDQTGGGSVWTDGGDFLYTTNGEDVAIGGTTEANSETKFGSGGQTKFNSVNYLWPVNGTNGSGRVLTVSGANAGNQLKWSDPPITRINSGTGAAGGYITWHSLAANSVTCTAAAICGTVMTTTNVGIGTWLFKYTILYQTAATTTGISYAIKHSGTVGTFNAMRTHITTGTTQTNGTGDSDAGVSQLVEGYGDNDHDAIIGVATIGVDAASTSIIAIVEGIITVTAAGTGRLELKQGSEVAGSAVQTMANSTLELTKIK